MWVSFCLLINLTSKKVTDLTETNVILLLVSLNSLIFSVRDILSCYINNIYSHTCTLEPYSQNNCADAIASNGNYGKLWILNHQRLNGVGVLVNQNFMV